MKLICFEFVQRSPVGGGVWTRCLKFKSKLHNLLTTWSWTIHPTSRTVSWANWWESRSRSSSSLEWKRRAFWLTYHSQWLAGKLGQGLLWFWRVYPPSLKSPEADEALWNKQTHPYINPNLNLRPSSTLSLQIISRILLFMKKKKTEQPKF